MDASNPVGEILWKLANRMCSSRQLDVSASRFSAAVFPTPLRPLTHKFAAAVAAEKAAKEAVTPVPQLKPAAAIPEPQIAAAAPAEVPA